MNDLQREITHMKRIIIAIALVALSFSGVKAQSLEDYTVKFSNVVLPPVPSKLSFAGEAVPLHNYDTRESLQRELLVTSYMHSRTLLTLIATTRYFPVIEPILKKYGIPDDFKYLCMAESGLNPNVMSGAGAAGLWQLMPATGRTYGLYGDKEVDQRYDIERSTEAACKHLLESYSKFGSWTMAAAAYNLGDAGVQRRVAKQGTTSYYDSFLPEETLRYVFRILSFKVVTENPLAYGFVIAPNDYQKPLDNYTTAKASGPNIDWSQFARQHNTSYKMLRQLNHWIRDYNFANKQNMVLEVKIPTPELRTQK